MPLEGIEAFIVFTLSFFARPRACIIAIARREMPMTAIERRLLTCRLLDAMTKNPEYSKELQLKNLSAQRKNNRKEINRKEINDGEKA